MSVPFRDGYTDGILIDPGEHVVVPFSICLKTSTPFRFLVDVLGRDEDTP